MNLQRHLEEAFQAFQEASANEQTAYEARLLAQGRIATIQGLLAEEKLKEASESADEEPEDDS